jgi:hypothetical protein
MVSSRDVSAKRKEDTIIDTIVDFINDVQSEERQKLGCSECCLGQYQTLCPWFKLHHVSHYKAKRKRAAEQ